MLTSSDSTVNVLRRWGSLGRGMNVVKQKPAITWVPLQRMIEAAKASMTSEGNRLRRLLNCSIQYLTPLGDPLVVDFGAHRWLKRQREEAYSDWLAWILEQLETPQRIHNVFGLDPVQAHECHAPVVVGREVPLEEGHEGHAGRIDLTVSFGERLALVIEVKKTDADNADTVKGAGYSKSLPLHARRVLLAVSGERETYEGNFHLVTWGNVCTALRNLARTLCQENSIILAAMILAFVGAVEENLLGFPVHHIRRLMDGIRVPVSAAVGNHLEQWLKEGDADGSAE